MIQVDEDNNDKVGGEVLYSKTKRDKEQVLGLTKKGPS